MADIRTLSADALPDCDQLFFEYRSNMYSDLDPYKLASILALEIQIYYDKRTAQGKAQYESITLVGHSIGALLMRAAYLIATDHPFHTLPGVKYSWAPAVTRLVLLAGLNNGWKAPAKDEFPTFGRFKSALVTAEITRASLTGSARFMLGVMRGSRFVADVRLNWLEMIRYHPELEPKTVQLSGSTDDLITSHDIQDSATGRNFKSRTVGGSSHFDLGILTSSTADAVRNHLRKRERLLAAKIFKWLMPLHEISDANTEIRRYEITTAIAGSWEEIESQSGNFAQPDPTVKNVVMIRHGIRDNAQGWVTSLEKKFQKRDPSRQTFTEKTSFGRFSMIQFLLRGARLRRVRDFVDQYIDLRVTYPEATIHFVGHSYGTYIGCRALRDHKACKFGNVALANSVMASDFPWKKITDHPGQADHVLNVCGTRDAVVALFPGAFQTLREWFGINADPVKGELLGKAGFSGMNHNLVTNAVFPGKHDAGIQDGALEKIADFIVTGKPVEGDPKAMPNGLLKMAAHLPFVGWFLLPMCVFGVLFFFGFSAFHALGWTALGTLALVPLLHTV